MKRMLTATLIIVLACIMILTGCGSDTANAGTAVAETTAQEAPVQVTVAESTAAELTEMADSDLATLKIDRSLIGIGDYAVLKDSNFKIADNVKFKTAAVNAVEINDKGVDFTKAGKYEAEAKITTKDGEDKSRKMNITVYDKDEMTEELASAGVITGVYDIAVQEGTDVKVKDLIFVNSDIVTLINVDETKVDVKKAGEYKYTVTYAVDTEKAQELEDKLNEEIDERAKAANGSETAEEHVDFHIPEDCDYAALTKEFTVKVVTPEEAANANDGPYAAVVTPENKDQAIEENRNAAGESAKSVDDMNAKDTTTESATTVPETTAPETTAPATTETQPAPTQGTPQDGSNDRPAEQNTDPTPAETGRSGEAQPATPYVPSEPQTTAHTHSWVWVDEVGHYETVIIQAAWDEPMWTGTRTVVDQEAWDETVDNGHYVGHSICDACGAFVDLLSSGDCAAHMRAHALAGEQDSYYYEAYAEWVPDIQIIHHDAVTHQEDVYETVHHDAVTEQRWVVDKAGYYRCSSCGETK